MFNAAPLERLPISDDDEKEELKIMKTRSTSQLRVDARPDGTIKLYLSRDVRSAALDHIVCETWLCVRETYRRNTRIIRLLDVCGCELLHLVVHRTN